MTPSADEAWIGRLHEAGKQFVLAVTGGGSQAIARLLCVPGASQSVLEARVPYAAAALGEWLGAPPEHACTEATARAMAMVAFERARRLMPADDPASAAGIACTASLATVRPKRGAHRVFAAAQTLASTTALSVELVKGRRTRGEEEALAADVLLAAAAAACGMTVAPQCDPHRRLDPRDEPLLVRRRQAPPDWQDLLAGRVVRVRAAGDAAAGEAAPRVIFPGAFHPLHAGHLAMAELATRRTGRPVELEISLVNVDKPPLDYLEIEDRLDHLAGRFGCWLTRAATFVEKAAVFPGATFVVGADTIARIENPKYYGGDLQAVRRAIEAIAAAGCRFLVFGRVVGTQFATLDELPLSPALRSLCEGISPEQFRLDLSSTELRARAAD